MKLNNKGFAITSIIYSMLILFLTLVVLIIGNLASRKAIFDKQKEDILDKSEKPSLLPDDYIQLNYIGTDGVAYIDSGLAVADGYQVELKAQMIGDYSAETWFLGNWNQSPKAGYLIGAYKNYLQVDSGNDSEGYYGRIPYDEEIHTYSILNDKIIIDETIFNVNLDYDLVSNITGNMTIGKALHYNSTAYSKNIYYLKIWDKDNNLVRDFIPCYRTSDNVAGLYDLVEKKFYTNAGTGEFVQGKFGEEIIP